MSNAAARTITSARVRNALRKGGVPVGHHTYSDVAHIVALIDYWGVGAGIPSSDATPERIKAALTAAGLPFEQGNYIEVPRRVES